MDSSERQAFVSLATNDFYATGALTLGRSLRDSGTTRKLALVITSGVSEEMRNTLSMVWDDLILVEEIDSGDADSLAVLRRPELGVTFTKIAVWTLTQYTKCVFLDADTLVLCNVDELFLREELSAAPDVGWPDCFNSGVFVFCPSLETFRNLLRLAQQIGSFDGGDQGLLNLYWKDWSRDDIKYHLPFVYNMTANSSYGYAPAFLRFKDDIKIIHFIGSVKPWQHTYLRDLDTVVLMPGSCGSQGGNQDFILRWWRIYSSLFPSERQPSSTTSQGSHHTTSNSHHTTHQHCQQPSSLPPPPSAFTFTQPYQSGHSSSASSHRAPLGHTSGHAQCGHSDENSSVTAPQYTVSSSNRVLDGYRHSITPLDSISQVGSHDPQSSCLASSNGSDSLQRESLHSEEHPSSLSAGSSSPYPISVLSHEDVHSHISLSFYATNVYDQISSLVDTEPRTYYIEDLKSESDEGEEDDEEKTGIKQYAESLASSSHVSLPTFITPSSSAIFKNLPRQMDFLSKGSRHDDPPSYNLYRSTSSSSSTDSLPLAPYTEYDVTNETPAPCDSMDFSSYRFSTPALGGSWEGVGGDKAWSDSVQLYKCPSVSLPLSPPHSPPSSSTSSLPNLVPKDLGVDAHTAAMEGRRRPSDPEDERFSHRREFEMGNIDYHGKDSFDNIMALIETHTGVVTETTPSSHGRGSGTDSLMGDAEEMQGESGEEQQHIADLTVKVTDLSVNTASQSDKNVPAGVEGSSKEPKILKSALKKTSTGSSSSKS